jgi:hypothetical protein
MANNPSTLPDYNGQTQAPNADYPYGSARNDVSPGDLTGTPRIAAEINDIFGFQQALLNDAGIVPNGSPDTVLSSQYLDALKKVAKDLTVTASAKTWYVDPILGSDAEGQGEGAGADAFRTIQYAYDQLPQLIIFQQTIQLADGVYNTNYLAPAQSVDLPRPAILFGRGKFIASRTQKSGNDLEGGIIIKGNPVTPSNVVLEPTDTYNYGIYNGQGQLGIQDLIIRPEVAATSIENLLTAHRNGARIHAVNVSLDGRSKAVTSNGIICESGGEVEFTTNQDEVQIKNCDILARTLVSGDLCTITGNYKLSDANIGLQAIGNSEIKLGASGISGQTITNCTTAAIFAAFGAYVTIGGKDDIDHTLISSRVTAESGAVIRFVWVDTDAQMEIIGSTLKLNNSDFQDQVLLRSSDLFIEDSDSFIFPNVANNNNNPLALTYGSRIYKQGTNNIIGPSGLPETYNPITLTYTSDSEVQAISESTNVYRINGSGANRLTCEIDASGVAEGRTIYLDGDTWGVEFTSGTNMDIPSNFTIGNSSGNYSGAIFTLRNGKWRVNALGQQRP